MVSKQSKLAKLSPFMDDKGIMRVGGRLENANLPYSQKHPVILPSSNFLTSLIVHDVHMKTLHGGQQLMMATLRSEYWILRLKSTTKQCIHKCLRCYRFNATRMQQQMGNLPTLRVTQAQPFQTTGVDYAGPVQLKAWKGRCSKVTKAYIAIFVCFCTKAVHLELVSDYTTSAFLAAFKRFTARRGICSNLYSDCGTNFKGAANGMEFEKTFMPKQWTEDIGRFLLDNGTHWHFNPPAAPHFGGLWEAGVKSMKYHLKRVIGHYTLTFEEYGTVLTQVEACLNSRPLCPINEDPDDLSILTPGHFLIGSALNTVPEKDLTGVKDSHLDRWQLMQRIHQDIWKKWKSEYLVRL
ncbi:uncharacterized protein LOC129921264 [Episyrphus balteatus]|uniref:uncharacterized protein LOC129921264 n=1 Tax=Episyrphus balteatus TaxID=286459 RepID=UPI0024856247|nr:uncharacterized protein LOC129921264 [Episyrphus balteatus]